MNDVTRPGRTAFAAALEDIDLLHDRLAGTGATIVTTTFPDLEQILPVGRFLGARVLQMNTVIRAAAAKALNLPGSKHDWTMSTGEVVRSGLRSRSYSQALWTQNLLMPWVWRHLRGLSSGNGRAVKRPRLQPVALVAEAAEPTE